MKYFGIHLPNASETNTSRQDSRAWWSRECTEDQRWSPLAIDSPPSAASTCLWCVWGVLSTAAAASSFQPTSRCWVCVIVKPLVNSSRRSVNATTSGVKVGSEHSSWSTRTRSTKDSRRLSSGWLWHGCWWLRAFDDFNSLWCVLAHHKLQTRRYRCQSMTI